MIKITVRNGVDAKLKHTKHMIFKTISLNKLLQQNSLSIHAFNRSHHTGHRIRTIKFVTSGKSVFTNQATLFMNYCDNVMGNPNYSTFNYGFNLSVSLGYNTTSLILLELHIAIKSLSSPIPHPECGGIPHSKTLR